MACPESDAGWSLLSWRRFADDVWVAADFRDGMIHCETCGSFDRGFNGSD